MKILLFCPALGVASGSGVRARLLAEGFRHWGAEVVVVAGALPLGLAEQGVSCFELAPGVPWQGTLEQAIAAERPAIVYGVTEAGADQVLAAGRRSGLPVAFDLHGLGFIEVIELGGGYGSRPARVRNSLRWLAAVRRSDLVTVANPTLLPLLRPVCRSVLPVFGMTDIAHFRPDGPASGREGAAGRLRVLYAGNHYRWQGIDLLVAALAEMGGAAAQLQCLCLGSVGQDERRIADWKARIPGEVLEFRASVDYREVADHYRAADVLVIPRPFMLSTYLAFPQKLVDAMASGRAIVATDLAPHRWALQQGQAGLLCPPRAKDLAAALQRCGDAGLRQRFGNAARQRAVEEFCHLRQTQRILQVFRERLRP